MTYEILLLFAFVRTISYQNWFVYVELYYLQNFTTIAQHLNVHIRYVICSYLQHMGSQNYELVTFYLLNQFTDYFVHWDVQFSLPMNLFNQIYITFHIQIFTQNFCPENNLIYSLLIWDFKEILISKQCSRQIWLSKTDPWMFLFTVKTFFFVSMVKKLNYIALGSKITFFFLFL